MVINFKQIKKKFENAKKLLQNSKFKHLCVTITTNTSLDINKIYCAPLRQIDDILIFGFIVYSTKHLKIISKLIDKKVDLIFIDAEKKIPFNIGNKFKKNYLIKKNNLSYEFIELGNLTTVLKSLIKNVPILEFKPNDITVEHSWKMIRDHFKILSKKKLAIFGAGNIGFKLGLKLVESGVNIKLFRRNLEKCMQISNTINLIKPVSTLAEASFSKTAISACYAVDGIIASANEKKVIKKNYLKAIKPNGIIIDIGKGNLDKDAFLYAQKKKIKILRCDITETLVSYVRQNFKSYFQKSEKKKLIKGIHTVSGGNIGNRGSIIVNDCADPKEIIGISDGYGNFKNKLSKKDFDNIKKLKKNLNII